MSSETVERPDSGSIQDISFGDVGLDVTAYIAEHDLAPVVEVEGPSSVRVYVNGVQLATTKVIPVP